MCYKSFQYLFSCPYRKGLPTFNEEKDIWRGTAWEHPDVGTSLQDIKVAMTSITDEIRHYNMYTMNEKMGMSEWT